MDKDEEGHPTTCAFLLPGQGSVSLGMAAPWRATPSWSLVDEISDGAGCDVAAILDIDDLSLLIRTDNAQIATFTVSLLSYTEWARRSKDVIRTVLGHSLGELSALAVGGYLSIQDAAKLVRTRGLAMQRASGEHPGSMSALMGSTESSFQSLQDYCQKYGDLWIANINGEGQIVVSGSQASLLRLQSEHRDIGWRRCSPLNVGGAFHSPMMSLALEEFSECLNAVTWLKPRTPVLANVNGTVHPGGAATIDLLLRQLVEPVDFLNCVGNIPTEVDKSVEAAPGTTLTGLVSRIRKFSLHETLERG